MSFENRRHLFIPPSYCHKVGSSLEQEIYYDEIPVAKLEISHPGKLLELLRSLTGSSTKSLETKINHYFQRETESETVFFINILTQSEEAFIQILLDQKIEPVITSGFPESNISKIVHLKHDVYVCAENLDSKLQTLIEEVIPNKTGQMMIVPVLGKGRKGYECVEIHENVPVYLICLLNPQKENSFVTRLINETFKFCLSLCINTRDCEEERLLKKRCQAVLLMSRRLFPYLTELNCLVKEIMSEARRLVNAETCTLYLINLHYMQLIAEAFDESSHMNWQVEIKIAKNQGIAAHVACTGRMMNVKDVSKQPLFHKMFDQREGQKTRNLLAIPIRTEDYVVGVMQLNNKVGSPYFDYYDEQVARAFNVFCGMALMHSMEYKKNIENRSRNQLAFDTILSGVQVTDEEVTEVLFCKGIHDMLDYESFSFSPRKILHKEIPCFVMRMFEKLNFVKHFHINREYLVRFLLFIKKCYKDHPYHNFMHAFVATHFCYVCFIKFQLIEKKYISKLEALSLFIAMLCLDIDHTGAVNIIQSRSSSVAARIQVVGHIPTPMEKQHFILALAILNTEGCNILEGLNRPDYNTCLLLIRQLIDASELSHYTRLHTKQMIMATEGYKSDSAEHRFLLCALLVMCSVVSECAKDWFISRLVAQLVYSEFFMQGDLIKSTNGVVDNMIDRTCAEIPRHQIEFLSEVVYCIFRVLALLFPASKVCSDHIRTIVTWWEESREIFERMRGEGMTSYEIISGDEFPMEVKAKMEKLNIKKLI